MVATLQRSKWATIALVGAIFFFAFISAVGVGFGFYHIVALPSLAAGAVVYYLFLTARTGRSESVFHLAALLTIFLCAVWPRYAAFFIPGLPLINLQRIANIALIVTLAISLTSSSYLKNLISESLQKHGIFWFAFSLYMATRVLSIGFSDEPFTSAYRFIQEILVHAVFIITGLHFGSKAKYRNALAKTFVICGFIAAAASAAEYVLGRNIFSYFIRPQNEYMAWALSDQFRDGKFRAKGTFDHPLTLAEFISIATAIGALFLLSSKRYFSRYAVLPAFLGAGLMTALFTGSRSGYAAMAIVIAMLLTLPPLLILLKGEMTIGKAAFWSIASIFLGAFLTVGIVFVFDYTIGRHSYSESDAMRAQMFERTLELLKASPFWGHGVGLAPEKIGVLTERTRVYTVDSFFMSVAVESGAISLMALLFMFLYAGISSIKNSIRSNGRDWLIWAGFGIAVVVCVTFKSILSLLDNNHLMFLLLGIGVAPQFSNEQHE